MNNLLKNLNRVNREMKNTRKKNISIKNKKQFLGNLDKNTWGVVMEKLNTGKNNKTLANLIKTSKSLKNVSNLKKLTYRNRKLEAEIVNMLINDILESCKPNEKIIFKRRLDSMSNLDRKNLLKIYDNYLSTLPGTNNYNNIYKKHNKAIKECKRRIRLTERMEPLSASDYF